VAIARPLDEVFAFVSDARNRPSWDESVDSEETPRRSRSGLAAPFARLREVLEGGS
jgi:hypothetical protein